MHAFGAAAEFAGRLRAAEKEFADDGGFGAREIENFGEAMFVFGDAAVAAGGAGEHLIAERAESGADRIFVECHERIAIRFLVAGVDERVERKRIVFRSSDFLFDESAEDSGFNFGEDDIHGMK